MSGPEVISLNFAPESLIYEPSRPPCYLYFEGPVQKRPDGFIAIGPGMVLILYPSIVGGKPGGQFFISYPSQIRKIEGLCSFGGNLFISPLSGGRTLHVEASSNGTRFLIEKNGKVVREVRAVVHNDQMKFKVDKVSHFGSAQQLAAGSPNLWAA